MKNQIVTSAIVLRRTDYKEADRIIVFSTPHHGKLSAIAKGVRRPKSKLAGGIELLSVSEITYLPGRGELGTVISARSIEHYRNIVKDIDKTMLSYDLLKRMNRLTEDAAGEEYFLILQRSLEGLNQTQLNRHLVELWFNLHVLSATGHMIDLKKDNSGAELLADSLYNFEFSDMAFRVHSAGAFSANHIKLLRLVHAAQSPAGLINLRFSDDMLTQVSRLVDSLMQDHLN